MLGGAAAWPATPKAQIHARRRKARFMVWFAEGLSSISPPSSRKPVSVWPVDGKHSSAGTMPRCGEHTRLAGGFAGSAAEKASDYSARQAAKQGRPAARAPLPNGIVPAQIVGRIAKRRGQARLRVATRLLINFPVGTGRDAFQCVPDCGCENGDAVEGVPTEFWGSKCEGLLRRNLAPARPINRAAGSARPLSAASSRLARQSVRRGTATVSTASSGRT